MMKIKVYHNHGIVKITKITENGLEYPMFSNLKDGDMVEIDVDFSASISVTKNTIPAKTTEE